MEDTIKMLKQCNAGAKMAIGTIERVYPYAKDSAFKDTLSEYIKKHEDIVARTRELLSNYCMGGKDPNPIAEFMAEMTTKMRLKKDSSDRSVASMIIEGCDMGTKKLKEYEKKYCCASEDSFDTIKNLMDLENKLKSEMQTYL